MRKLLCCLLLVAASAAPAAATTLARMDLDDLTAASQTIVYGKIVASRTEWDKTRSVIYTFYTVRPIQYLKGQLGPEFLLQEMGGTLDGLTMTVPSAPQFAVGQEEVLFIWTDPLGRNLVTGMEQGAVGVHTDPQTGQRVLDRALRIGSARGLQTGNESVALTSRLLAQFFDQVRRSAAKASQSRARSGR